MQWFILPELVSRCQHSGPANGCANNCTKPGSKLTTARPTGPPVAPSRCFTGNIMQVTAVCNDDCLSGNSCCLVSLACDFAINATVCSGRAKATALAGSSTSRSTANVKLTTCSSVRRCALASRRVLPAMNSTPVLQDRRRLVQCKGLVVLLDFST